MKKRWLLCITLTAMIMNTLTICSISALAEIERVEIHVAPNGTDLGNTEATEINPLATLAGARDFARAYCGGKRADVIFHEGEYRFAAAVTLSEADSGTLNSPVTYKSAAGEKVIFKGTTKLDVSKFQTVSDQNVLNRLYDGVRNKVVQLDLKQQGIPNSVIDFTRLHDTPLDIGENIKNIQFYLNDQPQRISRWPNSGYEIFSGAESSASWKSYSDVSSLPQSAYVGSKIYYTGAQPERWTNAENLFIEGFFANYYHGEWAKVGTINTADKFIQTAFWTCNGASSTSGGKRWSAVNLLEEIDIPGEWFVNETTGILYYYPPYDLGSGDTFEIGTLNNNFIRVYQASYINFEGIEFAKNTADVMVTSRYSDTGGNGIAVQYSNNININNCVVRDIGLNGIQFKSSNNCTVSGCMIYNTGGIGILVYDTGERTTLTSGNIVIKNNQVAKTSLTASNNLVTGILIHGDNSDGVLVENNIIHNSPSSGLRYKGNEHLIQYNEIYNCVNRSGDAGAIYCGRSWGEYGNTLKYNYIHDIGTKSDDWYWCTAMYFDDGHSGNIFTYNIVNLDYMNNTRGTMINNGRDNIVYGNTYISAQYGLYGGNQSIDFINLASLTQFKGLTAMPFDKEPFITKYPGMNENYTQLINGVYTRKNTIINNFMVNVTSSGKYDQSILSASRIENITKIVGQDYSMFVDPDSQDFRVRSSAKTAYNVPDGVLDETFDINLIGIQNYTPTSADAMNFNLTYPENNACGVKTEPISLAWDEAPLADEYEYIVAADAGFTDESIVARGVTRDTAVKLSFVPQENTEYYWKVNAVNTSRQIGNITECNKVFCFSTKSPGFSVENRKLEDNVLSYDIYNSTENDASYAAVAAVKSAADNKLMDLFVEYNMVKKGSYLHKEIEFNNEKLTESFKVEIFFWNNFNELIPWFEKK